MNEVGQPFSSWLGVGGECPTSSNPLKGIAKLVGQIFRLPAGDVMSQIELSICYFSDTTTSVVHGIELNKAVDLTIMCGVRNH